MIYTRQLTTVPKGYFINMDSFILTILTGGNSLRYIFNWTASITLFLDTSIAILKLSNRFKF